MTCVSFDRSLSLLKLKNPCGAYGLPTGDGSCDVNWESYQREGWCDDLRAAEADIARELGSPLCAREICDERHLVRAEIQLRQTPVDYLGRKVFGEWTETEFEIPTTPDERFIEICDTDLGSYTIDSVEFSYPDSVLSCYNGCLVLQAPCIERIIGTCGGVEDGYRITWDLCQLVNPEVDTASIADVGTDVFLSGVKWRGSEIDATLAVEVVGSCSCEGRIINISLADATDGLVCVENTCNCGAPPSYIRINYAVRFGCDTDGIDPVIEKAVSLLALVYSKDTPSKPCGCDNRYVDRMLDTDPTVGSEFATKLRFGPTVAGMTVMRMMDRLKARPNFNSSVTTGGLLSARAGFGRNIGYLGGD